MPPRATASGQYSTREGKMHAVTIGGKSMSDLVKDERVN